MPRNWRRVGRLDPARNVLGEDVPAQPFRTTAELAIYRSSKNQAVEVVHRQDEIDSQAAYDDLIGRGNIVALHRVGRINQLAQATPPVVIVTYTVPENYLFRFCKFGFQFGDPFISQLDPQLYVPMLVRVDQQPVLGLAENQTAPYRSVPGTIWNPIEFGPVWCIGGATITVEVNTFAAVSIQLTAMALIGGELVQRTSLKLGRTF